MRKLAANGYTAAAVEDALRAQTGRYSTRYDLLDSDLSYVLDLTPYVESATVSVDTTRAIMGGLDLTLTPDSDLPSDLVSGLWQYTVKVWWQVLMPDGGAAEFPLGVYVWGRPDRTVAGHRDRVSTGVEEQWSLTLGDLGHWLDLSGPGPGGFKVKPDDLVTDQIVRVLRRAGFRDMSGIRPSTHRAGSYYTWSIVRNTVAIPWEKDAAHPFGISITSDSTTPETWRTVLTDLTESIGYDEVWFDGDGAPQAAPSRALQRAEPDALFDTKEDGITLAFGVGHDWAHIANRVFCRTQRKSGDLMYGMADANKLVPNHPLAQRQTGRYVDLALDVKVSPAVSALEARARSILLRRLSTFQIADLTTMVWPAAEPFDVVGVSYDGDPEFDTDVSPAGPKNFHVTGYSTALRTRGDDEGTTEWNLRRTVQAT